MRSNPNTHRDADRDTPVVENRAVTAFVQSRRHLRKARDEARLGLDILARMPASDRSPLHDELVRQLEEHLAAIDRVLPADVHLTG